MLYYQPRTDQRVPRSYGRRYCRPTKQIKNKLLFGFSLAYSYLCTQNRVIIPPQSEQIAIVNYISERTSKIDTLIDKLQQKLMG